MGARSLVGAKWGAIVGRHQATHIGPIGAFASLALPGIETQPDTSADIRNLVRIEGVSSSDGSQGQSDSRVVGSQRRSLRL
jgi:hypothetical protein